MHSNRMFLVSNKKKLCEHFGGQSGNVIVTLLYSISFYSLQFFSLFVCVCASSEENGLAEPRKCAVKNVSELGSNDK